MCRFKCLFVLLLSSILSFQSLSCHEAALDINLLNEAYTSSESKGKRTFKDLKKQKRDSLEPSVFFQSNIGLGLLYFSGVKGDIMGRPSNLFTFDDTDSIPVKGRLIYNRTPLFEYLVGYSFKKWVDVALSYQYQGSVSIQTKALGYGSYPSSYMQLSSNLSLNGALAKIYLKAPLVALSKKATLASYLAIGVGGGWQSWTNNQLNRSLGNTIAATEPLVLRQKISENLIWMADAGVKIQIAYPKSSFNILMGCKYNYWGQARSIGKMSQQDWIKLSLIEPFRIKTIYQFAPYLGVQWNFSINNSQNQYIINKKEIDLTVPYWVVGPIFQPSWKVWTEVNAGIGFLYFSGVRGNLTPNPASTTLLETYCQNIPLKGSLSYNRTPLFEYLFGYHLKSWLKVALSYQYQSSLTIQTKALPAFLTNSNWFNTYGQFVSNLSLNAILAKAVFQLPLSLNWRRASLTPYCAVGVGPGWQSWTRSRVYYSRIDAQFVQSSNDPLSLNQKISANLVWMLDSGICIRDAFQESSFAVLMGCKYNQWGQARSIGKLSQQKSYKLGLAQPFKIKTVYQFAPYLGFEWYFASGDSLTRRNHRKERKQATSKIYWKNNKDFNCFPMIGAQFNLGMGFLYFSGLRGNLMGEPVLNFNTANFRDVPLKGSLSYNKTPLFEYLLACQFNALFRLALSYQYQTGVTLQTKVLPAFAPPSTSQYAQFISSLNLNGLALKFTFDFPYSLVCRNVASSFYFGAGVGSGWQSWTDTQVNFMNTAPNFDNEPLALRQKISANVIWMLDLGLRIQSVHPNSRFSVLLGCKYNNWGQARSIGKMSQQGSRKIALGNPFRIKTVYQFAPYFGIQWNY
ncbi:MAG: hypothetical protein S4CHLAM7_15450 [Chlamydiae bacterium]|nr:hypothetical protein [Chlamydiota bacterium]